MLCFFQARLHFQYFFFLTFSQRVLLPLQVHLADLPQCCNAPPLRISPVTLSRDKRRRFCWWERSKFQGHSLDERFRECLFIDALAFELNSLFKPSSLFTKQSVDSKQSKREPALAFESTYISYRINSCTAIRHRRGGGGAYRPAENMRRPASC